MILVPAGPYIAGSSPAEREQAYEDAERTNGKDRARRGRWFDREEPRHVRHLGAFWLDRTLVTNAAFARFEKAPLRGPADHPVTHIPHDVATAYCRWLGKRLPTEHELEKASRGTDGRAYPWGNHWERTRLNSMDGGPGRTTPVGAYPAGAGPYGHLDIAGNTFQWTSTPSPWREGEFVLKGSAWDDFAGVARGAQRHSRPASVEHKLVGFRCARTPGSADR